MKNQACDWVDTHAGFARPRTYVLSGNALVDTDLPAQVLERTVHDLIKDTLGPDLVVIARTGGSPENFPDLAGHTAPN